MLEVKTYDNNMRLYYLAFFSKSEKGYQSGTRFGSARPTSSDSA